jgi:hypothetical protein
VTNAISYPGLGSITVTVSNSSHLTGKCTYDASGLTKTHRELTFPLEVSRPPHYAVSDFPIG